MSHKLTATGLVVEYNPFHNGHIHHINESLKITDNDVLIAVMSPHFVQRGEPAFIDKWSRTQAALKHGVDIVIELPTYYALQSADFFASAATSLLSLMQIQDLVYGVESLDLKEPEFDLNHHQTGASYAASFIHDDASPNNNLALAYERALKNTPIQTHRIQRTNAYTSLDIDESIASASAIRHAHMNQVNTDHTSPMSFDVTYSLSEYEPFIKYAIATHSEDELKEFLLVDEGIEYLLKKHYTKPLEQFIDACISKRYTRARIQRTLMNILLGNRKDQPASLDQVRVLGFSPLGQKYLRQCKNDAVPVTTSFKQYINKDMEYTTTQIYSLPKSQSVQEHNLKQEVGQLIRKQVV